ncbi:MAG: MgtC/SapB family protein [Chloroflexi bacterium]|nr:MgtC/SapB family protein [Chloroflexota bacterium]
MQPINLTPWIDLDVVLRILMAAVAGGILGYEREVEHKPAGFRTHILVCTGAALITIVSIYGFTGPNLDTSRVAAGIVVGIGFLGAGSIIRGTRGVKGITTAANIWVVAALGMAIGAGLYIVAGVTLIIALSALLFHHFTTRKKK